ncbi:YcxB family protein [Paenibacillus glycanilyticus]|uniref:YcxB family protein n=1 Tax=Paenibacillus glycanilyticus TaxID=126569 RepID=UPI00203E7D27|nr:YcxB family protein [Paenibacillus glycanilyticus]MCM3626246.1 YcxB family protein [Paenibacillus glycanilyticus]
MKLNFKYSEREFIRGMNQSNGDSKRLLVDFIITLALLGFGIYLYVNGSNGLLVAFLIVISIVSMFIMFARLIIVPRVIFRKEPKYKEEYELEFLEEEIRFTAGALKSSIPWSFYKKIKETKEFIYLVYSKRGFAIIPKRVFDTPEGMKNFLSLISSKIKN